MGGVQGGQFGGCRLRGNRIRGGRMGGQRWARSILVDADCIEGIVEERCFCRFWSWNEKVRPQNSNI